MNPNAKPLRIGCVADLPLQRLQAFLGLMYVRDPVREVDVVHLRNSEVIRRLRAGELDLALMHDTGADGERERVFAGERLAAFLAIGHVLSVRQVIVPGDTAGEVLLAPPRAADPDIHDWLASTLAGTGHRFRAARDIRGAEPRDLLFAVAEGRGIAVGPMSLPRAAGDVAALVTSVALEPELTMPESVLVWPADVPAELASAIAAARAVARELA